MNLKPTTDSYFIEFNFVNVKIQKKKQNKQTNKQTEKLSLEYPRHPTVFS